MNPGNQILLPDLNQDWEEIDTMILFACFNLLEKYIKQEMHLIDWETSKQQKNIKKEIDCLMNWWETRKKIHQGLIGEPENQEDEDTQFLIRIIKIRSALWS